MSKQSNANLSRTLNNVKINQNFVYVKTLCFIFFNKSLFKFCKQFCSKREIYKTVCYCLKKFPPFNKGKTVFVKSLLCFSKNHNLDKHLEKHHQYLEYLEQKLIVVSIFFYKV